MKNEKLFRETPFGGYKRQDVLSYLETLELNHKNNIDELNERILELNNLLTESTRQQESMKKELEIKTEYAAQAEDLKSELEEKDRQIEDLIAACENMGKQADAVAQRCNELAAEMEKLRQGELNGKRIEQTLEQAEEQAASIIRDAQMEAEAILAEAQGQTEDLARQISAEASDIIAMTVKESQNIIESAKQQRNVIFSDSARSIGKIKGNLSSMQMVVKNIESELRCAKETLAENISKKEV